MLSKLSKDRRDFRPLLQAVALFLWAIFLFPLKAQAGTDTWTSLGPDGGYVGALFISPANSDVVLAAAGLGLFKSSNGGASWKLVYRGASYDEFACLASDPVDPNTLYVGSSGVYKSTDDGESW